MRALFAFQFSSEIGAAGGSRGGIFEATRGFLGERFILVGQWKLKWRCCVCKREQLQDISWRESSTAL